MSRPRLFLFLLVLLTPLLIATASDGIDTVLVGALARQVAPADLEIHYRAVHPLHGGTEVEIHGDGMAIRTTHRRGGHQAAIKQTTLEEAQVLALIELLVQVEAWEQRLPERAAVPDEGRASLEIRLGERRAGFWEWYNEMGEHDRLLRVSALMTELVTR